MNSSEAPCRNVTITVEVANCFSKAAKDADRKLNETYAQVLSVLQTNDQQKLRASQRLWIQFRDANCRFYGSQEGTIRQIQAAECLRAMTQDRALELEKAMKFD